MPDLDRLRSRLTYIPETGILNWKTPPTGRKVDVAGRIDKHGYVSIGFDGTLWKAHRLIWGMYYNEDPGELEIDHRNGIKHDNWIDNLRKATVIKQRMNWQKSRRSTSGVRGVRARPFDCWNASIRVDGVIHNLGNFKNFDDAVRARQSAEIELYGEFRRRDLDESAGK